MIRRAIFAVVMGIAAPAIAADEKAKFPNGEKKAPSDQDDPIGRKLSDRIGPFVQTGMFDRTNQETLAVWRKKYEGLPGREDLLLHFSVAE